MLKYILHVIFKLVNRHAFSADKEYYYHFFSYLLLYRIKLLTMFIKGNCAIYSAKNLKVYANSSVLFILWSK